MAITRVANEFDGDQLQADVASIAAQLTASPAIEPRSVAAIFIFGSAADRIRLNASNRPNDIDLLFVFQEPVPVDVNPFNIDAVYSLSQHWLVLEQAVHVVFNGVLPCPPVENCLILDLSWDSMDCLVQKEGHSIILAKKPRVVLRGQDVYAELEGEPIDANVVKEYVNTITHYVRREFSGRFDAAAKRAVAKAGILICSVLSSSTIATNDRKRITTHVRMLFPSVADHLALLFRAFAQPDEASVEAVRAAFESVADDVTVLIAARDRGRRE